LKILILLFGMMKAKAIAAKDRKEHKGDY